MVAGTTKAWKIRLGDTGSWLCTDDPDSVVLELESSTEDTPGVVTSDLLDRLKAMNEGDKIEVGDFNVTCCMVDKAWLDALPEHNGW